MGNLGLYVKNAKKRSRELRKRRLTFLGQGVDLKELIVGLTEGQHG